MQQRRRYAALTLICMTLAMASAERSGLSVAAPELSSALQLSPSDLGWLFSAFSWTYVITQIPAGLLVERFGVRRIIGSGLAIGSLCSVLVALAGAPAFAAISWGLILVARLILGASQSPMGGSSGMVFATWFPKNERGVAGSVYGSMPYLSIAVFNPIMAWVVNHLGWDICFLMLAFMGILSSAVWSTAFRTPQQHRRLSAKERRLLISGGALWGAPKTDRPAALNDDNPDTPPSPGSNLSSLSHDLRHLFSQRMFRGLVVAQYAIAAITWFFIAWFPAYLVLDLDLSLAQAGALSAFPAIGGFLGGAMTGFFSDALLKRTHSLTIARKTPVYVGMSLSTIGFLGCLFTRDPTWIALLMTIAFFGKGVGTMIWTLVGDLAPANRVGLTGSAVNAFTNLSGIFTPIIIGYAVAIYGNFNLALYLMAGHALLAVAMNYWVMGTLHRMQDIPNAPLTHTTRP